MREHRRTVLVAAIVLFLAVAAVFAVPGLLSSWVAAKARASLARQPFHVAFQDLAVGWNGSVTLREVAVDTPDLPAARLSIRELRGRVDWLSRLLGGDAPLELEAEGVTATVPWDPADPARFLQDLRDLRDRHAAKTASRPPAPATDGAAIGASDRLDALLPDDLQARARGIRVVADAGTGTPTVLLEDASADLSRTAPVGWTATAEGRSPALDGRTLTLEAGFRHASSWEARVRADGPVPVPLPRPDVTATVQGLAVRPGTLEVRDATLRADLPATGPVEASVARAAVHFQGVLPRAGDLRRVRLEGLQAGGRLPASLAAQLALEAALPGVPLSPDVVVRGSAALDLGPGEDLARADLDVTPRGYPPVKVHAAAGGDGKARRVDWVDVEADQVPLGQWLRQRLGQDARDDGPTTLAARLTGPLSDPRALVVEVRRIGASLRHRSIAVEPVTLAGVSARIALRPAGKGRVHAQARFEGRLGSHAVVTVDVTGLPARPAAEIVLDVPEQPCRGIVESIPPALLPTLGPDVAASGTVHGRVELRKVSPDCWYCLEMAADGDLVGCRIENLGPATEARLAMLAGRFAIPVDEGNGPLDIRVGPAAPGFVPLRDMSRILQAGPILSEDGDFRIHHGFSRYNLERALRLDLATGRYAYGGSTLTQQLVKNLFVGRTKLLSRKVEEALIVLAMEQRFTKDRILELYLNCIEYGQNLYGIGPAAKHYFDLDARNLTPAQIAWLMHLKPYPKAAWHWAKKGYLPREWREGVQKRMSDMVRFGLLSPEEFEAAAPYDPIQACRGAPPAP